MFRNLAFGENTLALRLENVSLREPLSDLRAGYVNRISCARGAQETRFDEGVAPPARKPSPFGLGFLAGAC